MNIKIAIVGRPNVGKSALFNRICGRNISIVAEEEGVTRDYVTADVDYEGKFFHLIDTGGIDAKSKISFSKQIKEQAEVAIEMADSIIMVVDSRLGVTTLDEQIAKMLLKCNKPLCLAVNRVDDPKYFTGDYSYVRLGIKRIVPISAIHGYGCEDLMEVVFKDFDFSKQIENVKGLRVTFIGRPNVGKSSVVNRLIGKPRCIVSDVAGTTRDSFETLFTHEDMQLILTDTAGIHGRYGRNDALSKYALMRTKESISRSDICVLVLDGERGLSSDEKRMVSMVEEAGKGCLIIVNKWDLVKSVRMEHYLTALKEHAPFIEHCPILFVSAETGRNFDKILVELKNIEVARNFRASTGQLNQLIERALQKYHPPAIGGKRLRIYYLAQTGISPPEFVLFVNNQKLMTQTYQKYLVGELRKAHSFTGVPLKIVLRTSG